MRRLTLSQIFSATVHFNVRGGLAKAISIIVFFVLLISSNTTHATTHITVIQMRRHNKAIAAEGGVRITPKEIVRYRKLYFSERINSWSTFENRDFFESMINKFYRLTETQLQEYDRVSKDLCLNIMVQGRGILYNGSYLVPPEDHYRVFSAHIYGNRIGFIDHRPPYDQDERGHLIIDGEDYGPGSRGLTDWSMTDDHVAWIQTDLDNGDYMVMFDGENLSKGEALQIRRMVDPVLPIRKNEVVFIRRTNGVPHLFIDERDLGPAADGDYDGKNLLILRQDPRRIEYNGQIIGDIKNNTWSNFTVKDGHMAWSHGPGPGDALHHVYYDRRDLGPRTSGPEIEGDHLAYMKHPVKPQWSRLIYDRRDMGSTNRSYSLAGNHVAFMEMVYPPYGPPTFEQEKRSDPGAWLTKVNIDGKRLPGKFPTTARIEITPKPDCTPRK